jgi:hypothetical protein
MGGSLVNDDIRAAGLATHRLAGDRRRAEGWAARACGLDIVTAAFS